MRADSQNELTGLRERVVTLEAALAAAHQENALLRQKVDALVRRVFGTSSEQIDPAQLELLLQLSAAATPPAVEARSFPQERAPRSRKESRPRLPEHLPVIEQILDPER